MDRPPPKKRYHSETDSDSDLLPFISNPPVLSFPFIQPFRNIVPDLGEDLFESKMKKKRKISESFQISSIFPGQQNSLIVSVKNFLKCLDTEELLPSLSILSSELAIAQEPVLLSIPMGKVLEGMMKCLYSSVSDVVLLAMNSILTLIEVASNYAPILVSIGSLPVLISKLANFSYIDIAEKSIKILEKISKIDPISIYNQNVFQTTMETIDFYELETQKNIITIGINVLGPFSKDPVRKNHLDQAFLKVFDYVSSPISEKILEFLDIFFDKLPSDSCYIKVIADQGLILLVNQILASGNPNVSRVFSIYKNLARMDSMFLLQIFNSNLVTIMEKMITGNPNEISEVLQILSNAFENSQVEFERFKNLLCWGCENIMQNASELFYKLIEISEQHLLLKALDSLIRLLPSDVIFLYFSEKNFSNFLAETLGRNDFNSIKYCISIVGELLDKIPEKVVDGFVKDGVFSRIKSFKLVGDVNKLEKPMIKAQFIDDFNHHSIFNYKMLEKSADANKAHTENVRKLVKNVKEIITKSKKFEKIAESRILNLKKIVCMLSSENDSEKGFNQLLELLSNSNCVSPYEFTAENIGPLLWNYISSEKTLEKLMKLFKNNLKGTTHLESIVKMMNDCIQFLQTVSVQSSQTKKNTQSLKLEYFLSDSSTNTYKHPIYFNSPIINFQVYQHTLIENIKKSLISVNSEHDLNILIESQRIGSGFGMMDYFNDFLEENYRKSMQTQGNLNVKIYAFDTELNNKTSIQDLITNFPSITQNSLKFTFAYKNPKRYKSEIMKNPSDIIMKIIKLSEKTGVSNSHKMHPYISILKFLFYSNLYILPMLNCPKFPNSMFESSKFSAFMQSPKPEKTLNSLSSNSPFLFSYSSRLKYFYQNPSISKKHSTQKISVNRKNIFQNTIKIMSNLQPNTLEVDFEGELGTGQGPTLEFYTIISEKIANLDIWQVTNSGLFPSASTQDDNMMKFVGQFIGKAIIDKRNIGISLSPIFWKQVFGHLLTPLDLYEIDPSLYNSFQSLSFLKSSKEVDSLDLYFKLPGTEIELIPNGSSLRVTLESITNYIDLIFEKTLMPKSSVVSFKEGLTSVIPISELKIFMPQEINDLVCGDSFETWSIDLLLKSVIPAHGFSQSSSTFMNLLKIMSEFSPIEQTNFLKFVTGSPRLPHGGIFYLSPKLTVVKKEESSDQHLPSVMTCQNYLKLPDYSSIEVLRKSVFYAMQECGQSFYLS